MLCAPDEAIDDEDVAESVLVHCVGVHSLQPACHGSISDR